MQVFNRYRTDTPIGFNALIKAARACGTWILLLSLMLWACDFFNSSPERGKNGSTAARADTAQYHLEVFAQNYGHCDSLKQNCISVRLQYPHFTSAPGHKVRDSLNIFVKNLVLAPEFEAKKPKKPEELIKQLIDAYESLQQDFPGYTLPWHLDRTVMVCYNTPAVLSIYFEESVFTGGAQPNTTRFYYSFDVKSGRPLQLSDILIANFREQLNQIAEKKFREVTKLKRHQDLKESGFWFENNNFSLNHNFAITSDGILFYFNRYEIGPYAEGPIELELKFKLIGDLVRDKTLFQP